MEGQEVVKGTVASVPKVLSDEEKRKRFADLRSRMRRSKLEVTAPAGKTGYWGPKGDANEMSRLEYLGFSVVKDDPKAPKWKANGLQSDGTYSVGDVILMGIDSDVYEFYLQENLNRATGASEAAKEGFLNEAESKGVPTFKVDKKH